MKSASAAYNCVVTVNSLPLPPHTVRGYNRISVKGLDVLMEEALDFFTDIYGTVVDAHYVVDEIHDLEEDEYNCWIQVVVTGLVDSEGDADVNINEHWRVDLKEQIMQAWDRVESSNLEGYDVNPINDGPCWIQLNR